MNYIVLLGGNIGDRLKYLANARDLISEQCGALQQQSKIYETAAWGVENQASFYNQVVSVQSDLSPLDFLDTLLAIEKQLGRVRFKKWGERVIDLDILFIDELVINEKQLSVPHPRLHERRFTLIPLMDIMSNYRHPILNQKIQDLLSHCSDKLEVQVVTSSN